MPKKQQTKPTTTKKRKRSEPKSTSLTQPKPFTASFRLLAPPPLAPELRRVRFRRHIEYIEQEIEKLKQQHEQSRRK